MCQYDKLVCEDCPYNLKWNSDEKRCSSESKCLPVPSQCRAYTSSSTATYRSTTTSTLPTTTIAPSTHPTMTTISPDRLTTTTSSRSSATTTFLQTTATPQTTTSFVRKFFMRNLRRCVCTETLRKSKSHTGVHYVCDPLNENGFLICQEG